MKHLHSPEGIRITLDTPSPGDHYKRHAVIFGRYGDIPAVIKVYPATPEGEGRMRREEEGLELLRACGIPGPRVLYTGRHADPAGWYLVMERLGEGDPSPVTLDFLHRVVATLAAHHEAGLLQNDTSPGNFLLVDGRLVTLDGATIRRMARPRDKAAAQNVAKFFYKLSPIWNDRLPELAGHYYEARSLRPTPHRIATVVRETARLRRRRAWSQATRSLGNHRWFRAETLPDGALLVVDRRHADLEEARSWAAARAPDGVPVYDLTELPWHRLRVTHGRGARYWVAQKLLDRMAVPSRQPVALMACARASRLWMAPEPASPGLMDALHGLDPGQAAEAADAVGAMLRSLTIADYRLVIRDLAWSDFHLGPDGPFLDLKPGQPAPSVLPPHWRRQWRSALERLLREVPEPHRDFAKRLVAQVNTP